MTKTYLAIALLLPSLACAGEFSLGVGALYSHQQLPDKAYEGPGRDMQHDDRGWFPRFTLTYRTGVFMAEIGGGGLSEYQSRNRGPIGCRPPPCCSINQDIRTRYVYAAGGINYPVGDFELFGMAGMANVYGHNHEYGTNEYGPNQNFRNDLDDDAPIYIFGASWKATQDVRLRFDITKINDVAKSYWTLSSDITAMTVTVEISL